MDSNLTVTLASSPSILGSILSARPDTCAYNLLQGCLPGCSACLAEALLGSLGPWGASGQTWPGKAEENRALRTSVFLCPLAWKPEPPEVLTLT